MNTPSRRSDFANANGTRLHYLDWGGNGPALLFLAGLGCTAYIYDKFAPRFTDRFHALAVTRRGHGDSDCPETGYDADTLTEDLRHFMDALHIQQAILVGHSMASVELSHFAAKYPERALKLVYLDAAYDRTAPEYKANLAQNPLRNIQPPDAGETYNTLEAYTASLKRGYPAMSAIWSELMDEEVRHTVKISPEGKVVERMPEAVGQALNATLYAYTPEDAQIRAPVLSIYAYTTSAYYLAPEYMTTEQQAQVIEFFDVLRPPVQKASIEAFRRSVPHAVIVEIPHGHHYCFIKHEELVFEEMRKFL